jgi:aspartate carbamoyltransferase catalytic subunit
MPKSLISIQDFTKDEILHILEVAKEFEANREQNFLAGKVVACLFFEPSTRTRLSFETAVNRLGARVIGFPDNRNTSQSKGETLEDTIKIVSNYVDMIVMRHPMAGAADIAASVASVPVINAGDGANQHPTQTILDLYAIQKTQGRLEGLDVNMVGDLKYGRAVHSLVDALRHFSPRFTFTSPDELTMPKKYLEMLDKDAIPYRQVSRIEEGLNECDILYMTRVQQERFPDMDEYNKVKDVYRLTASMLGGVRPGMKVMHPLPRVGEIAEDVDSTPYAYYFQQAGGGMYVRMAIISYLLGYR